MSDAESLKLVRVIEPSLIPKDLIEQIKNKSFSVQEFYDNNSQESFLFDGENYTINPLNHLYAIVDGDNKINGVLWCTIDGQECNVNIFSIERKYWNKGEAFPMILKKMDEIFASLGIKNYKVITSNTGVYEKAGFKKSPQIIMTLEVKNG